MKPVHYCLVGLCLLSFVLSSCQSGPDDAPNPEGQCTISFSVSNYRQISFDDLSASALSRATETISMTLANMSLTIFDAETGECVTPTILHKSDDYLDKPKEFPQFSVSLPYGHYKVLVLGYNGNKECNIASLNHISWADDYVPNTFLYCEDIILNKDASLNKEITLKHVVAAFRVTAEEATPSNLKKMRFVSTAGSTVLDATTGFAPQSTGRTSEIEVPSSYLGKEGIDFTVYLFLPEEMVTGNYTVQALDNNNTTISEKHFNDVQLRINYLTIWQGKAFEQGDDEITDVQSDFSVKWDMDWAGTLKL